jgi:replicative DNA helicase
MDELHSALTSEDYLMGAMVKDHAHVSSMCSTLGLESGHFETESIRTVWRMAEKMAAEGTVVDAASILGALETDKAGKKLCLESLSSRMMQAMALASDRHAVAFHVAMVKERYDRRRIIEVFNEGIEMANAGEEIENLVSVSKYSLDQVAMKRKSLETAEDRALRMAEEYREIRESSSSGVRSRWPGMQKLLASYRFGKLTIVGARPKMGKSTFALNEAVHSAMSQKTPTLFISIEMDAEELLEKAASDVTGIDNAVFRHGQFDNQLLDRFMSRGVTPVSKSLLKIVDDPWMTIEKICTKVREHVSDFGTRFVVIDYLQIISQSPGTKFQSRTYEIAHWTNQLRVLAKETKCAVMVLSQIRRQVKSQEQGSLPPMPCMDDLRDSGAIEQDAYAIVLLGHSPHADIPSWHGMEAVCARLEAHRGGAVGDVEMVFNKPSNRFMDMDEYNEFKRKIKQ